MIKILSQTENGDFTDVIALFEHGEDINKSSREVNYKYQKGLDIEKELELAFNATFNV